VNCAFVWSADIIRHVEVVVSGGVSRVVGRDDGGTLWDAPNCPEDEGLCSLAAKEQESPPYH